MWGRWTHTCTKRSKCFFLAYIFSIYFLNVFLFCFSYFKKILYVCMCVWWRREWATMMVKLPSTWSLQCDHMWQAGATMSSLSFNLLYVEGGKLDIVPLFLFLDHFLYIKLWARTALVDSFVCACVCTKCKRAFSWGTRWRCPVQFVFSWRLKIRRSNNKARKPDANE